MAQIKRFMINNDFPCPCGDGYGSIYKMVEFDENGKSRDISADFQCMNCDYICEVTIEGNTLVITDPINLEN